MRKDVSRIANVSGRVEASFEGDYSKDRNQHVQRCDKFCFYLDRASPVFPVRSGRCVCGNSTEWLDSLRMTNSSSCLALPHSPHFTIPGSQYHLGKIIFPRLGSVCIEIRFFNFYRPLTPFREGIMSFRTRFWPSIYVSSL